MSSIQLYGPGGRELLWHKKIDDKEYGRLCKTLQKCNRKIGLYQTLAMPVRTYSINRFAKDFFSPCASVVFKYAIKRNPKSTLGDVSNFLLCVVLDILTFPLRLLTVIPRVFRNALMKENPFLKYLRKENVSEKILKRKYVFVKLYSSEVLLKERIISESLYNSHRLLIQRVVNLRTVDCPAFTVSRIKATTIPIPLTPKQQLRKQVETKLSISSDSLPNSYYSDGDI